MNRSNEPLHAGEIYHLWDYLNDANQNNLLMQILINHAEDESFKNFLEEIFENIFQQEQEQVEIILKELGIRLPPAPPDRPKVEVSDIPAGARFHDPEIAHILQQKLTSGKLLCSFMTTVATKEYMETIFNEAHSLRTEYQQKLFTLCKKNGWYTSPPVHIK